MPELDDELEEMQRRANQVAYGREKLRKLEAITAQARGDLRTAKIEVELAAAAVETKEALVGFAEAAVAYQRQQIEAVAEGGVLSTPNLAPADASPPQGHPPGASASLSTPPSSPASDVDPASAGRPSLVDAPAPRTRARSQWNMERAREVLREKGVVKNSDVADRVGSIDAARIALNKLVDLGEAQRTGQRGSTRYHRQERLEDEELSGPTHTDEPGTYESTHTPPTPAAPAQKAPVDAGPPAGRGRTAASDGQEPSFQGLMHQRLVIKPMSIEQMTAEWPGRSEQEIRQALGENMKTGDVAPKRKGVETRYHGRA